MNRYVNIFPYDVRSVMFFLCSFRFRSHRLQVRCSFLVVLCALKEIVKKKHYLCGIFPRRISVNWVLFSALSNRFYMFLQFCCAGISLCIFFLACARFFYIFCFHAKWPFVSIDWHRNACWIFPFVFVYTLRINNVKKWFDSILI